ncbi:MAG: triose-phosphate isomerase [Vallitalea sp.]|nr:triose-phosphate isomerase [Vallitalea sp.]
MKKPIFGAGWKMYLSDSEACQLATIINKSTILNDSVESYVLPTFTVLDRVNNILSDCVVNVGAQNMCYEHSGAFTGEVSVRSLVEMGLKYVEIGHSERRSLFNDTHVSINRKVKLALENKLIPILCIGEDLNDKIAMRTNEVLEMDIRTALFGVDYEAAKEIIFAYEPIWAIGQQESAGAEYANNVHMFIRQLLNSLYDESQNGDEFKIVYGGSVTAGNAEQLMKQPHIDGVFVGRSSLDIESYETIFRIVSESQDLK